MTESYFLMSLGCISDRAYKMIIYMTCCTMDIYCMHFLTGRILTLVYIRIGKTPGTFKFCVLVWITCYLIPHILSQLPGGIYKRDGELISKAAKA